VWLAESSTNGSAEVFRDELALAILDVLNEVFPSRLDLGELQTRIHLEHDDKDLLDTIDGLLADRLIEGQEYRTGIDRVLRAVINIGLAPRGRRQTRANSKDESNRGAPSASQPDVRKVMVVHGRDERVRVGMFAFLRAIGLDPIEFSQAIILTGKPLPDIPEILSAAFGKAQAVIVLLTPDDEARLRPGLQRTSDPPHERELTGQARANVLFEAGMAIVSHPVRTILVQFGTVRPFSDVAGKHIVMMDGSISKRQDLAARLKLAGCPVDLTGTDWHSQGDLTPTELLQFTSSSNSLPDSLMLEESVIAAYTRDPLIRELDAAIAETQNTSPDNTSDASLVLFEKARALNLKTVGDLRALAQKYGHAATIVSQFFTIDRISRGTSLEFVLDIEVGRSGSLDELRAYYDKVQHSSTSLGYLRELLKAIQSVVMS
jgi:predicted nucleotide-binding protein